jgi:hypothetical protein
MSTAREEKEGFILQQRRGCIGPRPHGDGGGGAGVYDNLGLGWVR